MLCACSAKVFSLLIPEAVVIEEMGGLHSSPPISPLPGGIRNLGQNVPMLGAWFSGQKIFLALICCRSQKIYTVILHGYLAATLDLKLSISKSDLGRLNIRSKKPQPYDTQLWSGINFCCWFKYDKRILFFVYVVLWAFCPLRYPTPPQLLYGVWALTPAVSVGSAVGSCYLGRQQLLPVCFLHQYCAAGSLAVKFSAGMCTQRLPWLLSALTHPQDHLFMQEWALPQQSSW